MQSMFLNFNATKIETSNTNMAKNISFIWKLNNPCPNKPWVKKEL